MYQTKHWLGEVGLKSCMTYKTFFPLLPYQEWLWLWEPFRLWAYSQLYFWKVVDSCNKYKNYDLPQPSTMVRNTSSTSNYPIHTFWNGLFTCNPFPSCQRGGGLQQCYFYIHVHCQGCSMNKPTNPCNIIIAHWVLHLLHFLQQLFVQIVSRKTRWQETCSVP